jgi:hypothetical protein
MSAMEAAGGTKKEIPTYVWTLANFLESWVENAGKMLMLRLSRQ